MIIRSLDGGAAAPWVAGDEVYGADPGLRRELEVRGTGYVLAVACSRQVTTAAGPQRADVIAVRAAPARLAASICRPGLRGSPLLRLGADHHRRRQRPGPVSRAVLVRVAGRRWTVEETFQAGKWLAGPDQHQVRGWNSWHRWTILAMLASTFLGRDRRRRAQPPAHASRHDPADQQRDPPSAQRPPRPPSPQHRAAEHLTDG